MMGTCSELHEIVQESLPQLDDIGGLPTPTKALEEIAMENEKDEPNNKCSGSLQIDKPSRDTRI